MILLNLAYIVAIVAVLLGQLQPTILGFQVQKLDAILLALGVLAADGLVRPLLFYQDIQRSLQKLTTLQEAAVNRPSPINVLKRRRDYTMEELVREPKVELMITGTTLGVFRLITQSIRECVQRNCMVKLMTLDPEGACFGAACRSLNVDPTTCRARIEASLHDIRRFVEKLPPTHRRRVEVRLLDMVPSVGCTAIDMDTPQGKIIEQTYLHDEAPDEAPYKDFTAARDQDWYVQRRMHLQKLWNKARPYPLDTAKSD